MPYSCIFSLTIKRYHNLPIKNNQLTQFTHNIHFIYFALFVISYI